MASSSLAGLRDFRLLWIGGLLAALGSQMSTLALPLLVLRQTGSPVDAGTIGTVELSAMLITMLPGGAIADAVERRRLMRLCDAAGLVATSALALAVLNGTAPLLLVLSVAGTGALISSFYGPAAFGLLRAVVPEEQLGRATSRMQARSAAARLVGPIAGGALFAWRPAAPFVAETAGLLLSTTCVTFVRTRSAPTPGGKRAPIREQLGAGLVFLWRQPYLRTILLVFGLGMNSAFSALLFAGLTVASHDGRSGLGGGALASMTALGSLAGALLAPWVHPDKRPVPLITGTCWTCFLAVGVLTLYRPPLLIGALAGLCLAAGSLASIGFLTSLLLETPEGKIGRVQSAAGFLSSLVQPIGPLAAGALLGQTSATVTFALLSGVFALCALTVSFAPAIRRHSMPDPSAASRDLVLHEADQPRTTAPETEKGAR